MTDRPSSDDLIREFRASHPSSPAPSEAPPAPLEPLAPDAPPPIEPIEAPAPTAAADPFGAAAATEPYSPDAPATGDDRHADWTPRGRAGLPEAKPGRSLLSRLRPLAILAVIVFTFGGGIMSLFDGSTAVDQLTVGDCFNDPGADVEFVEKVDTIDCTEPHDFEVFAVPSYGLAASAAFPGEIALFEWADEQCLDAFEPYVGRSFESSELYFANMVPSSDAWAQGDRAANCMLMRLDSSFDIVQVTGSFRNSGI